MKFQFPYHVPDPGDPRKRIQRVIEVEAETFDEAVDLAVQELWRRDPPA